MANIVCPKCCQSYSVNDDVIGTEVECESCHASFIATATPISQNQIMSFTDRASPIHIVDKKCRAMISAMGIIVIINTILLIVLFMQRRTTRDNTSSISSTNWSAAPLPHGTPSELLLKYTELGELSYVEAVLKQNPELDVNRPRSAGNKTALYIACEKGYADIARLLLCKKADASICDSEKESLKSSAKFSPLTIAARNGHLSVIKMLMSSGVDIESRDDGDRTALYAAVSGNKPDVVRFLCESNAEISILARNGYWTPLTSAAMDGFVEVVEVLLKYGKRVNLELCSKVNKTALYIAVEHNNPDIVKLLCEANAMVNIICEDNETPLTYAAGKGFTDVVDVLLKYGKDLDLEKRCKCWYSATPLYHAASKGHTEAVAILCEAGADLNARSSRFRNTPRDAASDQGHEDTAKVLEKYEAARQKLKQTKSSE